MNRVAALRAEHQDEAASQEIQEETSTEIADGLASMEIADEVDDGENMQLTQDSAT